MVLEWLHGSIRVKIVEKATIIDSTVLNGAWEYILESDDCLS